MFRSAIRSATDKAKVRPCWEVRNGDHDVAVQGYSLLDGLWAGLAILAVCVAVLVTLP